MANNDDEMVRTPATRNKYRGRKNKEILGLGAGKPSAAGFRE